MAFFPLTRRRNGPRTVVDGRLVEPPMRSFSLQRFAIVSLLLGFLFGTNQSLQIPSRRRTDFGLWSLSEVSSDRIRIHIAGSSTDCPFRSSLLLGPLCTMLRDQLAHKQPPFFDENDHPFTVHRLICWTLFVTSLLGACWKSRVKSSRLSRNSFLDAVLDMVVLPLETMLQLIALLAFVLYPTWMRMQTMVMLQHQNSWFHGAFGVSVGCLLVLALGGNAISRHIWSTHACCQLGRLAPAPAHALVAAMAGYYRGSFASDSLLAGPSYAVYGSTYYSPTTMNWMLLCFVVAAVVSKRRDYGIGIILSWILTNIMAALFGQYQQEQQILPVMANNFSIAWTEFWQNLLKS